MIVRVLILCVLALLILVQEGRSQQSSAPEENDAALEKEMMIGREALQRNNRAGAVNRFKVVITRYHTSRYVPEALYHVVEIYLGLGIVSEAQTAAAVLRRNFPENEWASKSRDLLVSAGFEPIEDERSWISKAFR